MFMLVLSPRLPLTTETPATVLGLPLTSAVFPIGGLTWLLLTRQVLSVENMNWLSATLIRLLLKPIVQSLCPIEVTTLVGLWLLVLTRAPATCGTGSRVKDL